jgi:hypothetical protein
LVWIFSRKEWDDDLDRKEGLRGIYARKDAKVETVYLKGTLRRVLVTYVLTKVGRHPSF